MYWAAPEILMDSVEINCIRKYSASVQSDLPINFQFNSDDLKEAAVLVPIFYRPVGGWHVLLTKRTDTLSSHPGEVSFPGGKRDSTDFTLQDTALREAEEEVGLVRDNVEMIGIIEPTMTRYGIVVHPFIGIIEESVIGTLPCNPDEVADIFAVPLQMFLFRLNSSILDYNLSALNQDMTIRYYGFRHEQYFIQGITASICVKIALLMFNRPPDFEFHYPFHIILKTPHKL